MEDMLIITGPSGHSWTVPLAEAKARIIADAGPAGKLATRVVTHWSTASRVITGLQLLRANDFLSFTTLIAPDRAAENPAAFLVDLEGWSWDKAIPFDFKVDYQTLESIQKSTKHTLVTIGCRGCRTAYLDVPKDTAILRYLAKQNEGMPKDCRRYSLEEHETVTVQEFVDEFEVY